MSVVSLSYSISFFLLLTSVENWVFDDDETTNGSGKEIIDIAFWNNRAFLCVTDKIQSKSSGDKDRGKETKTKKTNYLGAELVEAPWPESSIYKWGLKSLKIQNEENEDVCYRLKSTVSIDVDHRGRLFVLLLGSKNCHPKVIVIDLILNHEVAHTELINVPKNTLRSLVVDFSNFDTRAYIGGVGDSPLIIYSLRERNWWSVKLSAPPGSPPVVPTAHLALMKPGDILYMTSSSSQYLFSLDTEKLEDARLTYVNSDSAANMTITPALKGEKLGKSSGLFVDCKGGLYYNLIRDYAVVRWDSNNPLKAEFHDVLLQSAELLPDVRQIFRGPQKNLWALNSVPNVENLHCTKILKLNPFSVYF